MAATGTFLRFPLHVRRSFAPRALTRGVIECLHALDLPQDAWKGVVAKRLNSKVHRASDGIRDVAIKECLLPSGEPDAASATGEFAALARFAEACPTERASAPRPLAVSVPFGTYAMGWIAGRSATTLLLSATDDATAAALGTAAGNWLRRFHEAHPLPPRGSDFVAKASYVSSLRTPGGASPSLVDRAAAALERTARAAASIELPASWIHGDMKSDNVLVDGDRVAGIDLHLVDENTVVYDLAPFVNHLHLLAASPRGLMYGKALYRMADAFVDAYSPSASRWRLPIAWLRAYLLLQKVAPGERHIAGRIATRAQRRVLHALVESLESA